MSVDDPTPTDWLKQLGNHTAAFEATWKYFLQEARRIALENLDQKYRQRISSTDIAHEALRSALSEVEHGRATENDSDGFRALLKTIVQRKTANAIKKAKTKRRDIEREVSAEQVPLPDQGAVDPLVQAACRETAEEIVNVCMEADSVARLITNVLYVFAELRAPAIQRAIIKAPEVPKLPALRTIQTWMVELKKRLEEEFPD